MKRGEFSLELINAETNEPMKEFTAPDGKVYVEAEPDLEYFIRCYREVGTRDPSLVMNNNDTTAELRVDNTYLGYDAGFFSVCRDLGLWKHQNGVSTFRALKMILKTQTRGGASSTMPRIGSVKALFYKTIHSHGDMVDLDIDKTNCLDEAFASAPRVVSGGKKKEFASVSGSAAVSVSGVSPSRQRRGRCLGKMTIHYTSALGLSKLGVLAPIVPPAPAATQAASNSSSSRTRKHNSARVDGGVSLTTETKRKRIKAELAPHRVVSPNRPQSDNLIDLTGDDDFCAWNDGNLIDLTGGDDD